MKEYSDSSGKPYIISASIGCAVGGQDAFDETLSGADKKMYAHKMNKKKHR